MKNKLLLVCVPILLVSIVSCTTDHPKSVVSSGSINGAIGNLENKDKRASPNKTTLLQKINQSLKPTDIHPKLKHLTASELELVITRSSKPIIELTSTSGG